jgi:hypothetical protein
MVDADELFHYGVLRRSGRYPWGSGETPEQRSRGFLGYVKGLRDQGVSDTDIAKGLGISTSEFRAAGTIARNETRNADASMALRLKDKGMSNVAIGQRMNIPESSVRSLLSPAMADKRKILSSTSDLLKGKIDENHYLDVGSGTENHLGISQTRLAAAVTVLRQQGYELRNVQVDQLGTGQKTTIKVLAPPGTSYVDVVKNPHRIGTVASYSEDGGRSYLGIETPRNVDSKRIAVRYAEQGGTAADGVVYIRPGVEDVSLGSSRYAQVRIAVDGTHYIKGMAMYKNDLPPGVDLMFNTNKSDTGNKLDALKPIKDDADSPFGSVVRQRHYTDAAGKKQLSALNIVNEEGDWKDWSRSLSSQVLSKQDDSLAKRQLGLALQSRKTELDEIMSLTNPVVKQRLLEAFADGADSASVHLKAAALPGQGTHVILPIESLKENEIYAPNYQNGDRVALVRFPHGGTFEIPEVTVNNKHAESRATLGNAIDAVGIHPKVAERLSGADFDGDTVLVIPNSKNQIKTSSPLKQLEGFDPKQAYPAYEGMKPMTARAKQQQMGDVSNLITDMTIQKANPDEIAHAVRHSMVVIDAEKHNLNYRQSYVDNGIASLKEKYQGRGTTGRLAGASTIISRASSEVRVADRKPRAASKGGAVDPTTGKKVFEPTGESYKTASGKTIVKTVKSTKLAEAEDARSLSSGTKIENIYADHSNALKDMANAARKAALNTGSMAKSLTASETYAHDVASLQAKLNVALKNKPLERQAQLIANTVVAAKIHDNPGMEASDLKKIKGQALEAARGRVGAKKQQIVISDSEWKAIQAGAISTHKLSQILDNADLDRVRTLATPRAVLEVNPSKLAIAKARLASGYTQAEVAESLGVPVSTLNAALHREGG